MLFAFAKELIRLLKFAAVEFGPGCRRLLTCFEIEGGLEVRVLQ
jgi:hypothetical protein